MLHNEEITSQLCSNFPRVQEFNLAQVNGSACVPRNALYRRNGDRRDPVESHLASLLGYSSDVRASPPQPRAPFIKPAVQGWRGRQLRCQNLGVHSVKLIAGRSALCNKHRLNRRNTFLLWIYTYNINDGSY